MCYDAVSATLQLLKYALHRGDINLAEELAQKLNELEIQKDRMYHAAGFAHPRLLCFRNDSPYEPRLMSWGLIPNWVKDNKTAAQLMNQTLNARGETIFEKAAFRNSARFKRCII